MSQRPAPAAPERSVAARRRRSFRAVALVGVLSAVLLLSGCLKLEVGLTVDADDTVSGSVLITRAVPKPNSSGTPTTSAAAPPLSGGGTALDLPKPSVQIDSITAEEYTAETEKGYKYTYDATSFEDAKKYPLLDKRGGAMEFTRNGDQVSFTSTMNLTYGTEPTPQDALISKNFSGTVTITFPGAVTESNGTIEGNKVTWKLQALKENVLTASATYPEESAATTENSPTSGGATEQETTQDAATEEAATESPLTKEVFGVPAWILGAGALLVLLLLIGLIVVLRGRRKDSDEDSNSDAATAWGLTGSDDESPAASEDRPRPPNISPQPDRSDGFAGPRPSESDSSQTRHYPVLPPPPPAEGLLPGKHSADQSPGPQAPGQHAPGLQAPGPWPPPPVHDYQHPPVFAPPPPQFATPPPQAPPVVEPVADPVDDPAPSVADAVAAPTPTESADAQAPGAAERPDAASANAGWPPPAPRWQESEGS